MWLAGSARWALLIAGLAAATTALSLAVGARSVPAAGAAGRFDTAVGAAGNMSAGPHPLPEGRHMEPIADALSDAATLPPGYELLVGPGQLSCTSDACILRDQDDPALALRFGIATLVNGQRAMLTANPALLSNPTAVRLVRRTADGAYYQALEVVDARTRAPIGQE